MKIAVFAQYDGPFGERGEIVSVHRTHQAAEKAARNDNGFLAIREVPDTARKGDRVGQYD